MTCPHCAATTTTELPKRTRLGYRIFRCSACRRQYNERTNSPFNYLEFPTDIVLLVVMWRVRYKLSLRDLAEMFLERGFEFTHEAVREWEARFAPLVADKLRAKRRGQAGRSWHVDETYIRVGGKWKYLYRAIDRDGNLVDSLLSDHRDMDAAKRFLKAALEVAEQIPERVTTDGHDSYPRAIRETLGEEVTHRCNPYLNNRIEQDHRGIKQRYSPIRGFGTVADLTRSKPQLVAENLLLRQQLIVLNRSVKRPRFTRADRTLFVLLASCLQNWKDALLIVKPETVLRWHRQGFRLFWMRKSRPPTYGPKISVETITLIKEMAAANRLWGAERIRGELLKVGIKVAKRTVQRYMKQVRPSRPHNQTWSTFLRNHASDIWACDFLQLHDLLFRPVFAFFITELGSRRIIHVGVTRSPTDAWAAQQLREATPFGQAPKYLIRDNDAKYGAHFNAVAVGTGIEVLRTPIRAPRANATCERLMGSVRRECLDHVLIASEAHLRRVLKEYVAYFNRSRPHQGINQRIPELKENGDLSTGELGKVIALPILGGLHHDYQRAA